MKKITEKAVVMFLAAALLLGGCSDGKKPDDTTVSTTTSVTTTVTTTTTTTSATTTTVTTTTPETTTTVTTTTPETTTAPETSPTEETTSELTENTEVTSTDEPTTDIPSSYNAEYFADDYFIGDSIYTGLTLYGYFSKSKVFAQIGLNPETARYKDVGGYTAVSKAKELQPKRIFVMLGTNGLSYMSASYMAGNMKALVEELKEECPESEIYVVSIPPVTKYHDSLGNETMEKVNAYNSLLREKVSETEAEYLDLCSELLNSEGYFSAKYAEADGLHFLGSAYVKMLSFFETETSSDNH